MNINDIAVIGYSGRFPKAKNASAFWNNLSLGNNCISEVKQLRWDPRKYYDPQRPKRGYTYSKWGGFIDDIDLFDPIFFNIPPVEAKLMDPQQRIFLEVVWETLEHAGYSQARLSGSNTGVFLGCSSNHYINISQDITSVRINGLNNANSLIANRVSYFMNFYGPSLTINSQCTSSMMAIHKACQSILSNECELAIAGGTNLLPDVNHFIALSQMMILSPTNENKVFDQNSQGFVLGECVGAILLKPLDKALKDNDNVHAVIKGCAVNSSGNTGNIMSSDSQQQANVIKRALENARIDPRTISYIESGATGTPFGDVTEIKALTEAYKPYLKEKNSYPVGVLTPNIGNSEAAGGIAAVIKVILALKHKKIPPVLYYKEENPLLKLADSPFYINTELVDWKPKGAHQLRAGINSFGIGGTNAHIIIEAPPEIKYKKHTKKIPYMVLTLSGKSINALKIKIKEFKNFLISTQNDNLLQICYTANTGRNHFNHRIAYIADCKDQLIKDLEETATQNLEKSFIKKYRIYYKVYTNKKDKESNYLKSLLKSTGINPPNKTKTNPGRDEEFKYIKDINSSTNQKNILESLDKLCRDYCNNEHIQWNDFYKGISLQKAELPFYPFENKSYWFNKRLNSELDAIEKSLKEEKYYINRESSKEQIIKTLSNVFIKKLNKELHYNIKDIDLNKDIAEYGFDSLFITSLINLYEEMLGIEVPLSLFIRQKRTSEALSSLAEHYFSKPESNKEKLLSEDVVSIVPATHKHFYDVKRWLENNNTYQWLDPFFHDNFTLKDFAYFLRKRDKITFIINYLNKSMGICGLTDIDHYNESGECWIVIGEPQFKAKGIVLQAGKLLFKYAFEYKNLNTLVLKIREDNKPAIAATEFFNARKVGLLYESIKYKNSFYNRHIYQITKNEFQKWLRKREK